MPLPSRLRVLALITDRTNPAYTATRVRNLHLWPALASLGVDLRILGIDREPLASAPPASWELTSEFFPLPRDPIMKRVLGNLQRSYHERPHSEALATRIDSLMHDWQPDIVHAEELRMGRYLPCLRDKACAALQTVALHNVESDLLRATGSSPIDMFAPFIEPFHRRSLERLEESLAHRADRLYAYSPVDHQRYRALYPQGHWGLTAGGTEIMALAAQTHKQKLLIVGSLGYAPNQEGLDWFLREVRPLLPAELEITVAGSNAPAALVGRLGAAGIHFESTPSSERLHELYQETAVVAVPLLSGSGTRGRILEALAHSRSVATTSIGAEGLPFGDKEGVVTRNDPQAFAQAIMALAENPSARAEQIRQARPALRAHSWASVADGLLEDWRSLLKESAIARHKARA